MNIKIAISFLPYLLFGANVIFSAQSPFEVDPYEYGVWKKESAPGMAG